MEDFTSILLNQLRLGSAVKNLSIDELRSASAKLEKIISKRIEKENEEKAKLKEKQKDIKAILATMEKSGLTIKDLKEISEPKPTKKPKNKVPPKYRLVDDGGQEHLWSGRGNMPLAFKKAVNDKGMDLSTLAI